ncbi:hypothetical protein ACDY96_27530 [Rhizobium mongolense]|uniref:hypothetical protein n=1 Tax=Rhizobium TaxID=379 RepID=UPI0024B10ADD|nr:hypothetical protein [Rhizobium sp. CC1099]WFU91332.1 hypothetical protein QA644_24470 [Rhizobium sp. CC1099]
MYKQKSLIAGALGLLIAATSVPAAAMPIPTTAPWASNIEQVQYHRHDSGYWHGYRGERDYHRGYRRHRDGFWYPFAAFGVGALIGGAVASQPHY